MVTGGAVPDPGTKVSGAESDAERDSASSMVAQRATPGASLKNGQCSVEKLMSARRWGARTATLAVHDGRDQTLILWSCSRHMDTPYGNEPMDTQSYGAFQYPGMWKGI